MNGLREQRYGPGPVNFNPFEDEEDRRFVPVPEAVKTDLPYGPGPVGFDPFEGEEVAPQREVAPEQVRGLKPPTRQPEKKRPWLEEPIEPILGTTAEEALMVPLQVLRGTQELAAGVGAGIQWLGNRLDNKIIKEAGEKLSDYYRKEAERIGQPKSIAGKNVFDDPELLANPSYWIANTAQMAPSLAAAMIPAVGAAKTIQVAGQALNLTPALVARLASLGAAATGGAVGGAMEGAQTYQTMLDEGADEKEAARAGELMTLFAGTLNAVGINKVLAKAGNTLKAKVIQKLGAGAWEGVTEGLEEPSEVISKLLAKHLTGQELPGKEEIGDMFFESMKAGLTVLGPAALTGVGAATAFKARPPTDEPIDLLDVVESGDKSLLKSIKADAKKGLITPERLQATRDDFSQRYPKSTQELQDLDKLIEAQAQVQPIDLTEVVEEGAIPLEEVVERPPITPEEETEILAEGEGIVEEKPEPEIEMPEEDIEVVEPKAKVEVKGVEGVAIEEELKAIDEAAKAEKEEIRRKYEAEKVKLAEEAKTPLPELEIKPTVEAKPEEVGKVIPEEAKEPWEMTHEEFLEDSRKKQEAKGVIGAIGKEGARLVRRPTGEVETIGEHQLAVEKAFEEGKITSHPDYPELGKPEPTTQEIDQAAKETETEPTEAQIEAGNYKKGHIALYGFDISIENPKGSVRSGVDRQGKKWSQKLKHHYGYIKGTVGKDKDHLDVFIGPNPESDKVFVIDQVDPETGRLDEHKILMGFPLIEEARDGYLANYESGWRGIGAVTPISIKMFKSWVNKGNQKRSFIGSPWGRGAAKQAALQEGLPDRGRADTDLFGDTGEGVSELVERKRLIEVPTKVSPPEIPGGKPTPLEGVSDREPVKTVPFTKGGERPPISAQTEGFGKRPPKSTRPVKPSMIPLADEFQVVRGVIQAVPIPVMDNLAPTKRPSKKILHDETVSEPLPAVSPDKEIGAAPTIEKPDVTTSIRPTHEKPPKSELKVIIGYGEEKGKKKRPTPEEASVKVEAEPPEIEVIPSSQALDIRNMEVMPKGTGVRYLEVIRGEKGEYIAKQWRRKPPEKGILVDFGEKPKAPKPKPVKDRSFVYDLIDEGGLWDPSLPGEIKDLITGFTAAGKLKRAKGVPIGLLSKKTGRGVDERVSDMVYRGYQIEDVDHFIRLLEQDIRAIAERKPENRVRPADYVDEAEEEAKFNEGLIENARQELRKEGLSDQEIERTLEEGSKDAETTPVDKDEEIYEDLKTFFEAPTAELPPPPANEADYITTKELREEYRANYFDQAGEMIAPSQEVPAKVKELPIGTWRIDEFRGVHGRDISQLRLVDPNELIDVEEPEKHRPSDVERYEKWGREGKVPPPIEVVEDYAGNLKIVDGHRRSAAAKRAGIDIVAWVGPTTEHPEGLKDVSTGKVQRVGLTYELATGKKPEEIEVPGIRQGIIEKRRQATLIEKEAPFELKPTKKVLTLNLKKEYWDAIKVGDKKVEYRLLNDFWKKRLEGKEYDEIHLKLGYPKKADVTKTIILPWEGYKTETIQHKEFGPDPVQVFSIKLGEEITKPLELKPTEPTPEEKIAVGKERGEIVAPPKVTWEELVPDPSIRKIIETNGVYSAKDFKPIYNEFEIVGTSPTTVDITYKGIKLGEFPSKYANAGKIPKSSLAKRALDKLFNNLKRKKAVIPTEKIPVATKGEQVSLLPPVEGEQITIEGLIDSVKDTLKDERGSISFERAKQKPFFKAVAIRLKDGTVYEGSPGEIHVNVLERLPHGIVPRDGDGFIDQQGKFYTREEASAAVGEYEAVTMRTKGLLGMSLYDNLVTVGKDVITEGHTKYSDFAKQMRDKFAEIWDKIRNIMMRVWRAASAKLKEETGAIYYKETKIKPEDRQWAKDYLDKLTKETDKEKVIARGKKQEETLKEIPEEEDRPKEASPYEKEEDDWFGNKDWAQQVHTVEAGKIQDAIKTILNKNRYDKDAQNIDQAIHIYLDIKRNPGHVDEYYDELTDDQKKIINLAATIEDSPGLMKVAEYIGQQYEKVGQIAKSQNVIFNILDNYVARAWKIPKKLSTDVMQKFKTTSRHAKHRVFETILEGQAKGFELEVTGASNNLELLKDEISRTIEDKRLISTLRKTEWKDTGNPIIIHKQIEGYEEIKHPNFTYWVPEARIKHGDTKVYGPKFRVQTNWGAIKEGNARATKLFDSEEAAKLWLKDRDDADKFRIEKREYLWRREPLYAPEEIAKRLNKILGVSKLKGLGPIDTITKYNAVFKSTILLTSLFHHQAFIRSYLLGTRHKTLAEWNPFKMYKEGLKAINELRPEIELLVRNGLTLGKMQDWEENILRQEDTIIGKVLEKTHYTKAFKDWANEMRERQAKFLFQNFGAGLKAQAALIEYRNMMKEQPDLEPNERAKMVAELINDDFGGLHLRRMGRDPTTQHIFRLLALASDWTESNVNTMWKAFRSGDAAKTHLYRRFWASVATKGLTAMIIANILLSFTDEDDLIERFKKAWKAGHFRWLDIDVTPIYKLLGGKSEARKYFSVFGHFRDPLKFMFKWATSAKHKGSVFFRMFFEAFTGTDWKGHRFTTLDELLGYDDKGLYVTETKEHKIGEPKGGRMRGEVVTRRYGKEGPIGWSQIPSYMIHQLRAVTPVQVQNFLGWSQGEIEAFDAIGRSIGAHVGSTYPTERNITEDFVNQWIEIKRARGSFKDLKKKVNEYNERQLLRGEKGIPVSWSTISQKGINIIKAERAGERRKAVNY